MTTVVQHTSPRKPGSPHRRFTAVEKLLAIAPMLEHNRLYARGYKLRPPLQRIAEEISAQHGVCIASVWRWYCKYKRGGYAALSHPRSDAGRSRYLRKRPEVEQMIRARIAPGRSTFSIWNYLRLVLGREAPSYKVVLLYVKGHYRAEQKLEHAA